MRIVAPVTDYIPASVLTTLNDIVIRGAAVPERLAEVDWRGIKIGQTNRNANGVVAIPGVGFQPSLMLLFAVDDINANYNWSVGCGSIAENMCIMTMDNGTLINYSNTNGIYVRRAAGNQILGIVTAVGADGFTITWTVTGVCGCFLIYVCRP